MRTVTEIAALVVLAPFAVFGFLMGALIYVSR